jgi:hypothetical protein
MKKFKQFSEEMTFKVEVEGLPSLFMSGNSPGQVKNHLRKLIKQPSMIKSVERQTKHDVKKIYRDKAQGKDIDENLKPELDEISKDTMSRYKKAASKSNYAAAQKYARVAASPTSRKYKNKEMDRADNIGRKRKAGLAMADRKESLDERTPVRPTVQDKKLKNLRVPNPNFKKGLKRKRDNERSMDKFREDNVNEKLTIGKIRRAAYKTAKVLGDVQAVKKGKVARRVKNRVLGKLLGKAVGKLGLFK